MFSIFLGTCTDTHRMEEATDKSRPYSQLDLITITHVAQQDHLSSRQLGISVVTVVSPIGNICCDRDPDIRNVLLIFAQLILN